MQRLNKLKVMGPSTFNYAYIVFIRVLMVHSKIVRACKYEGTPATR